MSTDNQRQEATVYIRWMIRRDLPRVVSIEEDCFDFPWSEEEFLNSLRQRNRIGMVAEHDGQLVGFVLYELNRMRVHVLDLAVARDHQRLRIGRQIISKLIRKLSIQRRRRITLEIRETNLPGQLFFRAEGFRAVSTLKKFYWEDSREAAYFMVYSVKPTKAPVPVVYRFMPQGRNLLRRIIRPFERSVAP
jgi:ribosomal-protein-alanine N-acetyltransferase